MRAGGIINRATRSGQAPQRRHPARCRLISAQSASVSRPAAAIAVQPWSLARTFGSHSPRRPLKPVLSTTTSPIRGSRCDAPRLSCRRGNQSRVNSKPLSAHGVVNAPHHSRPALPCPPEWAGRGAGAVGLNTGRSRETCQEFGCRRAPDFGLAPEPRRRLRPLEPGRYAPAGSRDAMLNRQLNPGVQVLHRCSSVRQAHQ